MADLNGWTFDGTLWTKGAWTVARTSLVSWSLLRGEEVRRGPFTEAGWAMLYADTMDTDERVGWRRSKDGTTWTRADWMVERLHTGWVIASRYNGRGEPLTWGAFVALAEALHFADTHS